MAYTWAVELIRQATPDLCWDACARMMFRWRWHSRSAARNDAVYRSTGGYLASQQRGLSDVEMNILALRLGMRSSQGLSAADLLQRLRVGPVMTNLAAGTYRGRPNSHAVVIVSPRLHPLTGSGSYEVADPCARAAGSTCVAGTRLVPSAAVESAVAGSFSWYWF